MFGDVKMTFACKSFFKEQEMDLIEMGIVIPSIYEKIIMLILFLDFPYEPVPTHSLWLNSYCFFV